MISPRVKVLAPAGSFSSLSAALAAGADAVYFGVGDLNMRSHGANNFTAEDLPKVVELCHKSGAEAYLALNVIVYSDELPEMRHLCDSAKKAGVDAVIAADMAVISYANSINLTVHLSVQCNISNIESLKFYAQFSDVAVLARELTLPQITAINKAVHSLPITGRSGRIMELELFVHGAMCVAVSGTCTMSLSQKPDSSANRGACHQPCRRKYLVSDCNSEAKFELEGKYVMSPQDLCTLRFLPQLLNSGVTVLKIEGRARSADYVYTTVKVYKNAVRLIQQNGALTNAEIASGMAELSTVFNRGFWEGGYYLGERMGEWVAQGGNMALEQKVFAGKIVRYLPKLGVAEVRLDNGRLELGMTVVIIGDSTGCVRTQIESLHDDNGPAKTVASGSLAAFSVKEKVRVNDKVYLIQPRVFGENTR